MIRIVSLIVLAFISIMASAQKKLTLTVVNSSVSATLVDNAATEALLDLLSHGPITVSMTDYGGFEKVGALPQSLPTSNAQITTEPGDIMLYQGNNIVIFYGSNSWSYTRLGKIDDVTSESLRQFLGSGSISLTITAEESACLSSPAVEHRRTEFYDLNGRLVINRPLEPGIYIIDGVKTVINIIQ